jgi:hypothetical protein
LAKTADTLFVFDVEGRRIAETPAPPGPAVFQFAPGGEDALVTLGDGTPWVTWQAGAFRQVRSAERNRRAPRGTAPGLSLPGGLLLSASAEEIILRRPDGTETRARLSEPVLMMEQMGDGWVSVEQATRHTAVRVEDGRMETYRVPEAAR